MSDYKRTFQMAYSEADPEGKMTPYHCFAVGQDILTEYLEQIGCDNFTAAKYGAMWVIAKARMHVERYPRWLGGEITGRAYSFSKTPVRFDHEIDFLDASGELYFAIDYELCLIDLTTRKVLRTSHVPIPEDLELQPSRLADPFSKWMPEKERGEVVSETKVRYLDLDMNHHMNNGMYIYHILNTIPAEMFADQTLSDLEIHYLHESKAGDSLTICRKTAAADVQDFFVMNGEAVATVAKLRWADQNEKGSFDR